MVPHATAGFERRGSASSTSPADVTPTTYKFPDFADQIPEEDEEAFGSISRGASPKPLPNGLPPGLHSSERWPYKKQSSLDGGPGGMRGSARGVRHGRQKSLSEAIQAVRTRKMSITEKGQEIADSLKAPVSYRLVVRTNARNNTGRSVTDIKRRHYVAYGSRLQY